MNCVGQNLEGENKLDLILIFIDIHSWTQGKDHCGNAKGIFPFSDPKAARVGCIIKFAFIHFPALGCFSGAKGSNDG